MAPIDTKKADAATGPPRLSDYSKILDESTFEQILEMDDDEEDREFSRGIVYGFFEQAENTFEKIQNKIDEKDLPELSSLGHFLKGSSATLGLIKVKDGCEKIQHFGASMDETGTLAQPDEETSLRAIKKTLDEVVVAYRQVEKLLRRYYGEELKDEEEKPPVKEEKKTEEKPEAKEEPKKATEAKDTKDIKEPKEAKEPKDSKDSKEPEAKEAPK